MSSSEPSFLTSAGPEYPNAAEAQAKDIKTACLNMIASLNKKLRKFFKETQETQINTLRNKQNCLRPENRNRIKRITLSEEILEMKHFGT